MFKHFTKFLMTLTVMSAFVACENEIVNPATVTKPTLEKTNTNRSPGKALTASVLPGPWPEIYFTVTGFVGKSITVHWGDGTSENIILTTEEKVIYHMYPSEGWRNVSITGDLNAVTEFTAFQGEYVKNLDLSTLKNLKEFYAGYTTVEVVDLSRNTKIEAIHSVYSHLTQNIILPKQHNIRFIELAGDGFSTSEVDAIIESVYKNAVKDGIYNGHFNLNSPMVEFPEFAGPPSAHSMELLRKLRDQYGWSIFPNP